MGEEQRLRERLQAALERIEALEAANERLQEQLDGRDFGEAPWCPPRILGLTVHEGRLLHALYRRKGVVSKEQLLTFIYDAHADMPELKIIDVFVCKARKKLKPFGIELRTIWGRGYEMPEASRTIIDSLVTEWG